MASRLQGSDYTGLSTTFTGNAFISDEMRRQAESVRLDTPLPTEEDPGFAGVEIERVSATNTSNEKTGSYVRNSKRYYLTTTLKTGQEVYHRFTQDQWAKIADHMDRLASGMENSNGLRELSINLSTESALGHAPNRSGEDVFSIFAFPPMHQGLEELIRFVNPLIDQPVTTMPKRAYTALENERSLFPGVSSSDRKKELKRDALTFRCQELPAICTEIQNRGTYGLIPDAPDQTMNAFVRIQEKKVDALEELYLVDGKDILDKLTSDIDTATVALSRARGQDGIAAVTAAKEHLDKLKARKTAFENKKGLRMALALHYSPSDIATSYPHEAHKRTPKSSLEYCLKNAFDARFMLCARENLIDSEGVLILDTEAKVRKYQEITDTAALLIPHNPQESAKTDALINLFYAGGASLNALAGKPIKATEDSIAYPIFLGTQPPEYGEQSRAHEAMREIIQGVVYDGTTERASQVVDALRNETFRGDQGDTLQFELGGAVRYTNSRSPTFNLFSETEDEEV
jgi:hypothetical protein